MAVSMKLVHESFRLELNEAGAPAISPVYLIAARNDTASFQIILRSDKNYSVNVGLGEWASAKYRRLLGEHERLRVAVESQFTVQLQNVGFLKDDDETEKTDVLLNQTVRESRANSSSAVWAEVFIPADALPGEYTVTVKLFSALHNDDEVLVDTMSLPLRVAEYVMPSPVGRNFKLDLWQHPSNIARKHDVPLWSEAHFTVLRNYVRALAALGQKSVTVCASEIPWSGQKCFLDQSFGGNLFEYSMIRTVKKKDGAFAYDYAPMQQYIDLCAEEGISEEIAVFGIANVWAEPSFCSRTLTTELPETITIRYLDEADGCLKYMRNAGEIENYIRSLEAYFVSTHQIDRVRVSADEPADIENFKKSTDWLRKIAPRFRYKTAINHAEFIEQFADRIDVLVPHLSCVLNESDALCTYQGRYPEKSFLWYVCCGGTRPNTFLRSSPLESRAIGSMTCFFGYDGFLRWNFAVTPDDPRRELRYSRFEAGDTNFVYPAYNGDVLLSLRYKNLKRGLDDYELLQALRAKCGDDAVREMLSKTVLVQSVKDYVSTGRFEDGSSQFSMNFADYDEMKKLLLAQLSK